MTDTPPEDPSHELFADNPYVLAAYIEVYAILSEFMEETGGKIVLLPGWAPNLDAFIDRCEGFSPDHALIGLAGVGKCAQGLLHEAREPTLEVPLDLKSIESFAKYCHGYVARVSELGRKLGDASIDDPTAFSRFRAEAGPDLEGLKNAEKEKAARKGMPPHLALRIDRAIRLKDQDPKKK